MKFIQPRQKIYSFGILDTFIIFFKKIDKEKINQYFKKIFLTKNFLIISQARVGIYLAVKSIIQKKKKEIIVSPFTVFEVINMVKSAGGIPVFADLKFPNAEIDINEIKKKISRKTAGVIFTQYHGYNSNIKKLSNFLKKKKIPLIEDRAITYGCENKNEKNYSDVKIYSFNITKFVSCISGGVIVVPKNKLLFKKILNEGKILNLNNFLFLLQKFIRAIKINFFTNYFIFNLFTKFIIKISVLKNFNFLKDLTRNDPKPITYNYFPDKYRTNVTDFQIKEIYIKLKRYNHKKNQKLRFENYYIYQTNLSKIKDLKIHPLKKNTNNGCLFFPIFYKKRDDLYKYLIKNNLDVSKYYYRDTSNMKIFKTLKTKCKNSKRLCDEVIVLPTYPSYSKEQVMNNIIAIKKYFIKLNK